ncbi:MAG TPA: PTS transporter subunit EIIA [Thermoanaerobacterales bacterium]|nr:PTS transporter subunit EIIA [Thermoanaerobacterales bacterium]
MELKEILDRNIIRVNLEANSKDDVLKKMSQILYENKYISDIDGFLKDIYLREKEGITGIGNGIAIPHGKSKSVKKIGVAIANLKEEIDWETLDGKKVKTIFLFCVNDDSNSDKVHLTLLSRIAAKLADDQLLLKITNAKSTDEIVYYLSGDSSESHLFC